jgi:hypothetical protein
MGIILAALAAVVVICSFNDELVKMKKLLIRINKQTEKQANYSKEGDIQDRDLNQLKMK